MRVFGGRRISWISGFLVLLVEGGISITETPMWLKIRNIENNVYFYQKELLKGCMRDISPGAIKSLKQDGVIKRVYSRDRPGVSIELTEYGERVLKRVQEEEKELSKNKPVLSKTMVYGIHDHMIWENGGFKLVKELSPVEERPPNAVCLKCVHFEDGLCFVFTKPPFVGYSPHKPFGPTDELVLCDDYKEMEKVNEMEEIERTAGNPGSLNELMEVEKSDE